MNVRCNYCRQSFNLSRDFMAQAVAEAEEKGQKYYGVECINCRKLIKVPLAQLKRALPPETEEEEAGASEQ